MVNYYLKMEPHLFREAVNNQYERIKEEREATAAAAKERQDSTPAASSDKSELVLYRCPMPVLRETLTLCHRLVHDSKLICLCRKFTVSSLFLFCSIPESAEAVPQSCHGKV